MIDCINRLVNRINRQGGFTLLEILVTIIISAVLAVIFVQVMTNLSWRSYWPLQTYDETLALKSAMENITADYTLLTRMDQTPLVTLQAHINRQDGFDGFWPTTLPITASENGCLGLDQSGESGLPAECTADDTVLKVTLSYGNQSLTSLFTLMR